MNKTISLSKESIDILDSQSRAFNFSKWVDERIKTELAGGKGELKIVLTDSDRKWFKEFSVDILGDDKKINSQLKSYNKDLNANIPLAEFKGKIKRFKDG